MPFHPIRSLTFYLLAFPCLAHAGVDSGGGISSGGALRNHSSIGAPFDTRATPSGVANSASGIIALIYLFTSSAAAPPPPEDRNQNGLPDAWESEHFGPLGSEPAADPDNDGTNNLMEYLAGTNPNNASSTYRVSGALNDGIFRLSIPTLSNRQYRVWVSRDLQGWTLNHTFAGNGTIKLFEFDETAITTGPLRGGAHPSSYFFRVEIMMP